MSRAASGLKGNLYFSEDANEPTGRSEFLRKTISDKNFMQTNTKIVSASPYRAVVRRQEPPPYTQQTSRSSTESDNEEGNEDFDRENDPLDMGAGNDVSI